MFIEGEKITLRPIAPSDLEDVVRWTQDPEVSCFLEGDYPQSMTECSAWYQEINSNRHRQYFAILDKAGHLIGDMELDHITWRSGDGELRIRIGEPQLWGRGYGTDAVLTLLDHAFTEVGLKRVYLRVFTSNLRAIRCYQKAGLRREGVITRRSRDNQTREILLMRILKTEYLRRRVPVGRAG